MTNHLLPSNATALEIAVSESLDRDTVLGPKIDDITGPKFDRPFPAGFGPWVIGEYGLGGIERFFASQEDAVDVGIPWQRKRGTPGALKTALDWIGYTSITIEDSNVGRRKWNRYQINMGKLPADPEVPSLEDAEYLSLLSDGARDYFFRGFYGYDVRALTFSGLRWSGSIYGDVSGVFIGGQAKWSHGQEHTAALIGDGIDRTALGVDFSAGDTISWGSFPWTTPGLTWEGISNVPLAKAYLILRLPVWIGFYDAVGDVIGYRRVGEDRLDVTADNTPVGDEVFLQFGVRTGFGDGAGQTCATVKLVFNGRPAAGLKPGLQWLEAGQIAFNEGALEADMTVGSAALSITFGRTIRERVVVTLTI